MTAKIGNTELTENCIGQRNAPPKEIDPVCNAVIIQLLPTMPDPETGEMQYVEAASLMVLDPELRAPLAELAARIGVKGVLSEDASVSTADTVTAE